MPIPGALHNDEYGDIPPTMDFGNLELPPGVAKKVECSLCQWTYTSLDSALSARALARHFQTDCRVRDRIRHGAKAS